LFVISFFHLIYVIHFFFKLQTEKHMNWALAVLFGYMFLICILSAIGALFSIVRKKERKKKRKKEREREREREKLIEIKTHNGLTTKHE